MRISMLHNSQLISKLRATRDRYPSLQVSLCFYPHIANMGAIPVDAIDPP